MHTSGNGKLKDVIYHVYGREITANLIEVSRENGEIRITGFIGNPTVTRGNRNFETFFVNGRYIKSGILSKAVEDAYKDFTMQHKYPFIVLHLEILGEEIDVNVHPTKMELRFGHQQEVYQFLYETVSGALHGRDLIPRVEAPEAPKPPEIPNSKSLCTIRSCHTGGARGFSRSGKRGYNTRKKGSELFYGTDAGSGNILP